MIQFEKLPIAKKLTVIITVFSAIVCGLLLFSYVGMEILSGVRGIVNAEGLWSKSRQESHYYLRKYIQTHDEADYRHFLSHFKIPLADRVGMRESIAPQTNYKVAHKAFIEGGSNPQDVVVMTYLIKYSRWIDSIKKAVAEWEKADMNLDRALKVGELVHKEISSGNPSEEKLSELLQQVDEIDVIQTQLASNFSQRFGHAARLMKTCLIGVMIGITLFMMAVGLLIAFRISRFLVREVEVLHAGAERISKGDFSQPIKIDSEDEIGDLARRFQQMSDRRREAERSLAERARDLDEANKRLIETERLKSEFFANVSHELRTPLTLILAPLETLRSEMNSPGGGEKEKKLLTIIHNNAVRLLQMVTGLLDFSKLEAGKIKVRREPVEIVALTRSLIGDFKPMMLQKRLNAAFDPTREKAFVRMDRHLYERIVFNLVSNAFKFTPPEGRIDVTLSIQKERLTLAVKDTGIGINSDEIRHLFQKFRQVEGSSTRRFEGTGLGLAMVKEFAGLLGGDVLVESEVGHGSTFTVEISAPEAESGGDTGPGPSGESVSLIRRYQMEATRGDAGSPEKGKSPTDGSKTKPKVVVAEDNSELASYIVTLLSPYADITLAENGEKALQLVREMIPDVLISDVMMPERDGISLCQEVKKDPKTAKITVVLITALTHRDALLKGWEAGADEYLFKPFHPTELITRIRSILESQDQLKTIEGQLISNERELEHVKTEYEHMELIANMTSHDLREPLRHILFFSDMLQSMNEKGTTDESKRADCLKRLEAAAKRMESYFNDLLKFSQVGFEIDSDETVNLNHLFTEIQGDMERPISEARAKITREQLPTVKGDKIQLRQLFQNLLSNAVKFRRPETSPVITISSEKASETEVDILVADNGIGFDESYLKKIFEPFERLHTDKNYAGSGIGLAIAQKIVRLHKGSLAVKSRPGEGSVFTVRLLSAK